MTLNKGSIVAKTELIVAPVAGKADLGAFIDLAYRLNGSDPNWVPPLRADMVELLTPGRNPFHEHARVQYFLARRGGRIVGRISAHIDELALLQPPEQGMGPGTGNWGLMEAEDEAVMHALIAAAEQWLRGQGMTRVLAPLSMSVWEEPGLLTMGHDHPPMVMMGHQNARYQPWIEGAGYALAKQMLALVIAALPLSRGTVNGFVCDGILPDLEGPDLYDHETLIHSMSHDFFVTFHR